MANAINDVNQSMLNYFKNMNYLNIIGWIVFIIIIVGAAIYFYIYWRNKKLFSKKTTDFEIVGTNFVPTFRDLAKTVKLGSGGFEILYLKKMKTWRLAYGGRVGKDTYYFFRMPDGYPYNAMLSANLFKVDELKGLIPVVTTNASMRSQYTSLEKQIDALHQKKAGFWEKYGGWVMGIIFILVAGVMLWLMYKELVTVSANLASAVDKMGLLMDRINVAIGNTNSNTGGLVKA